jgi:type III pantothenate kinase
MSRWVFDLGNSRLKCARLDGQGGLAEVVALGHDGTTFADALAQVLPDSLESACLASVASPALTTAVRDTLLTRCRRLSMARTQARLDGLVVAYQDPTRLGVDRFLAMLAAHRRGGQASLVVGVGTAVTVDLIQAGGQHLGGSIAPSPRLMRQALHQAAAQLPAEGGRPVDFATDTADALASGCDGAAVGLILHSLEGAQARLGQRPQLLLHGGGSEALLAWLPQAEYAPSLVLEGLARWSMLGQPATA